MRRYTWICRVYFQLLSQHFHGGVEEKHDKHCQDTLSGFELLWESLWFQSRYANHATHIQEGRMWIEWIVCCLCNVLEIFWRALGTQGYPFSDDIMLCKPEDSPMYHSWRTKMREVGNQNEDFIIICPRRISEVDNSYLYAVTDTDMKHVVSGGKIRNYWDLELLCDALWSGRLLSNVQE